MPRKIVWVELAEGKVIRIFRSQKLAFAGCPDPVARYKDEAVGEIRRQVYDRQTGRCLNCGRSVPYEGDLFTRAHMHEVMPKGKGGEVSTVNSVILCYNCHIGPDGVHGNRRPRFGEQK